MRFRNCPNPDRFLEYVSIPRELTAWSRLNFKIHLASCSGCKETFQRVSKGWNEILVPEPEVTSSILKVYSRLQKDETLILKGWKLGRVKPRAAMAGWQTWAFRGAVMSSLTLIGVSVLWQKNHEERSKSFSNVSATIPYARIRYEDKNRVKVQYVQPQLLNSMEFETSPGEP